MSYDTGSLTVTPTVPTVSQADNQGRTYGADNPTLTAGFSGFVNGETLETSGVTGGPSISTTATAASPVGSYAITAGLGNLAASNYSFNLVDGTLTVTAAPDGDARQPDEDLRQPVYGLHRHGSGPPERRRHHGQLLQSGFGRHG